MRILGVVSTLSALVLQVEGGLRGSIPDRVYNCPPLRAIYQGSVSYSGTSPSSTATYTCNKGCVLYGSASRTCSDRGIWSGFEPACRVQYLRKNDNSYKNGDKGYQLYSG